MTIPAKETMENRTFDEINPGDSASMSRKLTTRDIELFAEVSGDMNPTHLDADYAKSDEFGEPIAHSMWVASLFSGVLGTRLPGPGMFYHDQNLRFGGAVRLGDVVTLTVTAREKNADGHLITFDCLCRNQDGKTIIEGSARVVAPTKKVMRARPMPGGLVIEERGAKFRRMIALAENLEPILTAVVHPVEPNAVAGAVDAALAHLLTPVFIGPEARIRAAAKEAGVDLSPYRVISTEHSTAAAELAAQMARDGKVHALMKGSLHTDEFLHPILEAANNLRTERRLSHVFLMDVPSYEQPLFITDGAINIAPDLEAKKDIVQNVILMAHALKIKTPRVAILSAVEVVNPRIPSTVDAAALCKMADRGQITGAILDGPLAFDNAVSLLAAKIKHIKSDVAGRADILIAPDLDAGNMIAKQLEYLASSEAAGVVLGARVPIILTSRADSAHSRLASCAVAALIWEDQGGMKP